MKMAWFSPSENNHDYSIGVVYCPKKGKHLKTLLVKSQGLSDKFMFTLVTHQFLKLSIFRLQAQIENEERKTPINL